MIPKDKEEEATAIIHEAMRDLDEFYSKIRKSNRVMKYKDDGDLLTEMFVCILASFPIMQILEMMIKNKIVNNKTGKEYSRKERFVIGLKLFEEKFELIVNQQLSNMS